MFDFTKVSRAVGFLLVAYIAAWPVLGVALLPFRSTVSGAAVRGALLDVVPWVFVIGSAVLAVDFFRRLNHRRLSATQVTGYRASGVMVVFGSTFALAHGFWEPTVLTGLLFLVMLAPTRGKATGETTTSAQES
ncbi:MAG: hypothetical protein ACXVYY_18175 [Oryzihumus sp.]